MLVRGRVPVRVARSYRASRAMFLHCFGTWAAWEAHAVYPPFGDYLPDSSAPLLCRGAANASGLRIVGPDQSTVSVSIVGAARA